MRVYDTVGNFEEQQLSASLLISSEIKLFEPVASLFA